jgi:uracil-DNA glycosylase
MLPVELNILQQEIRSCRKCVEGGFLTEARPLVLGQPGATVFLIGQAPSRTDNESGRFYEGPAGRKLRGWFLEAGFEESDFGTRIYAAAITKCFPGRNPGSSKDRVPSPSEQKLCRTWLNAELEAVQPKALVLFGGLAIKTFLSKAPLEELIGQVFKKDDGRIYLPLPHSSGASTWLNSPHNQKLLADALMQLRKLRHAI